jgi:hypothetical protein
LLVDVELRVASVDCDTVGALSLVGVELPEVSLDCDSVICVLPEDSEEKLPVEFWVSEADGVSVDVGGSVPVLVVWYAVEDWMPDVPDVSEEGPEMLKLVLPVGGA